MPPRTKKTTVPAPEKVEAVTEEAPAPVVAEADEKPKRGRKASPLTAVLKEFETAKTKLERAAKKRAGVDAVVQEHEAAQARYDAAKTALDAVYADLTA
ncbi:hypothetical protein ACGFZA_15835 [Streptomyces sp. NPDC048211]|uniref:hypothetical protein n=1 Tax=Streptomyces sp. NPDC048211 TaxID=3365516 RepID=UPI0037168A99